MRRTASLRAAPLLVLSLLLAPACGGGGAGDDDDDGPSVTPPIAPDQNDPAYTVGRIRNWYLIGNDLTPGQDQLEVQVVAPAGVELVDLWIDQEPGIRLAKTADDFRQLVDISALGPGEHQVLLAADQSDTAFALVTFQRSHPLYVLVTNDWDDPDNSDDSIALQEQLHEEHAELRMTHFVGPYTFTDPSVSTERADYLADWLEGMRDDFDDEIALHIHPYCSFVDTTEVTCRTTPSFVSAEDTTGYTVVFSSYTEEEQTALFEAADQIFEDHGLGKPTTFRAGGWTAELSTLRAMAATGYVADTSANNWARMEEWDTTLGGTLYDWNKEHWSSIGDTSQPYYPSEDDILVPGDPSIPVLEVPDNGIMVDYVTANEMIEIFNENWDGSALDTPVTYVVGYHPPNFNTVYHDYLHTALTHADQYLNSYDHGPVVYATLDEMPLVWKQ